jgi:rod shape determining protein RodA
MTITSHLKKIDWLLLSLAVILTIFGLILLYSLSSSSLNISFFQRQLTFLLIGIGLATSLAFLNLKALKSSSLFIFALYFLCILLLVGLFFFGKEVRGAKSWYSLGSFTFEPVEIVKIVFILLFAKYFSQRHVEMYQTRHVLLSGVYAALPAILVFFQPDFGSAIILIILWLGMMLVSGIKRTHLLSILGVGLLCFLVFWNFIFTEEQKDRFLTFLDPYMDPTGSGYHILQSIIAVGSGGIFGKGFSEPLTQAKLGFLPEAHTDFIFATFCEMFGMIGMLILFSFFFLFLWRLFDIIKILNDNFSRLLISGFIILVGSEVFINIAMNIGILPITGIPLPFLSYGGSSLLSLFIGIGIIESIKLHSK